MQPLKPGDSNRCPHCYQDHIVEQSYAQVTTAERIHLYVTCQGQQYFVGQVSELARPVMGLNGGTRRSSGAVPPRPIPP